MSQKQQLDESYATQTKQTIADLEAQHAQQVAKLEAQLQNTIDALNHDLSVARDNTARAAEEAAKVLREKEQELETAKAQVHSSMFHALITAPFFKSTLCLVRDRRRSP